MRFEEALKALRSGKEVKLKKSTGSYFMQTQINIEVYNETDR